VFIPPSPNSCSSCSPNKAPSPSLSVQGPSTLGVQATATYQPPSTH
jgi:hypothetical protein